MKHSRFAVVLVFFCLTGGCVSAVDHAGEVQRALPGDRLTVGTVQKEIRVGMSGADVLRVLGSPNIVSTDDQGREVWVYDRIATDRAYSTSRGGVSALILGILTGVSGALGSGAAPGYSKEAGAESTSQRTLTVIIKFGEGKKVRDFAYHSSRF